MKNKTDKKIELPKNIIDWADSQKPKINGCGCKIAYPHTHLVAGHKCECEKLK
jgi:hypothetical protein